MTTIYSEDGFTVTRRYRDAPRWHWVPTDGHTGRFVPAGTSVGYFPLVEVARPDESPDGVYVYNVVRDGDRFVESWVLRGWSEQELAARQEAVNARTIEDAIRAAGSGNRDFLLDNNLTNAKLVAQVRALTRQNNGLMRLVLGDLNGVD